MVRNAWRVLVVVGTVFGGMVAPTLGIFSNSHNYTLGIWLAMAIGVLGSGLLVGGVILKPKRD